MAALNDLIDLLLQLMRDPAAQARFEENPQATLQATGLEGVTASDVRDAQLLMADRGDVRSTSDTAAPSRAGSDPVREIQYTTTTYEVAGPSYTYVDDRDVTIDDRDVTIDDRDVDIDIDASDDDITVIEDSFNEDNDTVTAVQDNDTTVVEGSFNENTEVTAINESFNSDDDTAAPVVDPVDEPDPRVTTTAEDLAGTEAEPADDAVETVG